MSNLEIHLGDREMFRPGEEICGRARWELKRDPKCLEVSLLWRTQGKGHRYSSGVAETVRFENPGARGVRDFRLTAPSGPYSFSGTLFSIGWWVRLAEARGRNPVSKKVTISPTGLTVYCRERFAVLSPGHHKRSLAFRLGRWIRLRRTRLTTGKFR